MGKKNVVLTDNSREEMEDYRRGLQDAVGTEWEVLACRANGGRTGGWSELARYGKYFLFSLRIFLQRDRYDAIVGWQAFYGLVFAFWCRVFRVEKRNFLVVKNLTYREKTGIIGEIYRRFMGFIIESGYVDVFTCCSEGHLEYCREMFKIPKEKIKFVPFGVADIREMVRKSCGEENFVLSLGRSNRDWVFLIEALGGTEIPLKIVCDTLKMWEIPPNIQIYNNVWGREALEFLRACRLVVIPILDEKVAAGETVLLQAMSLGKPVVAVRESGKWEEYILRGRNGFVTPKDGEILRKTVEMLWNDRDLYEKICRNCRKSYEEGFSLYGYGRRVGELLKENFGGKAGDGGDPGVPGGEISGCLRQKRDGAELQESGNSADQRRIG